MKLNQEKTTGDRAAISAPLTQRGRASVDFIVHLARGSGKVRAQADKGAKDVAPAPDSLPDNLDERHNALEPLMRQVRAFRVQQLAREWHARNHGLIAREAFEDIRPKMEPVLARYDQGPAELHANPDAKEPAYWSGVNFHRTSGGWDGHSYQGFIHGEIVHRKMVDGIFPGGIFKQRRLVAGLAPKHQYDRILDMGCSTGHFTQALAETYPDAEIYGVDLSLKALEHARRVANSRGWAWKLYQRPAEDTALEASGFDLIASYIMLHEIPARIVTAVLKEAFRLLKPGGDLLFSDVTRYSDLDKVGQWKADMNARYGGEPHWRESAGMDLADAACAAGFVDVVAEAHGPNNYPYVLQGRKPQ